MALTKEVLLSADLANVPVPDGYTVPVAGITQTGNIIDIGNYTYSLTASSGVSTTPTLGLDALLAAMDTALATHITTTLGIDTATDTVTAVATINKIVVGNDPADIYENDATRTFEITFGTTITVV